MHKSKKSKIYNNIIYRINRKYIINNLLSIDSNISCSSLSNVLF